MTAGYALAIKRLYGPGIVRVASKHNLREIAAEIGADGHIDAARIADNFILRGPSTADGVAQLAKSLMEAAGVTKYRKTAVMALELLFTLPATTAVDLRQYFEQAISWAERHFGVPVLSCIVHLDEGAPHAHALLLPLVDGRMGGSDLHGGKAKLWAMQTSFHDEVGSRYGLARQTAQKRLSARVRAAAIELARVSLQANSALTDAVIDALLLPHAKDPAPLLLALNIGVPAPKARAKTSFASIMTAPCKPESRNPIGKANRNPIGKETFNAAPESQPYTCVGIAFPTAPIAHDFHDSPSTVKTSTNPPATWQHSGEYESPSSLPEAGAKQHATESTTATTDKAKVTDQVDPHPLGIAAHSNEIHAHPPGDCQRQRDDELPANCWDTERGEFVTGLATASSQTASRNQSFRGPHPSRNAPSIAPSMPQELPEARASPADIALDSIHELLALVSTTEQKTPIGQKVEP
jgi:hypothetical protein